MSSEIFGKKVQSPIGCLTVWATSKGVRRIEFGDRLAGMEEADHKILKQAETELLEYFEGHRRDFSIPLDQCGTDFQLRAWQALHEIPFGETRSYRQQAEAIGNSLAARAVGGANNKNPLPIVVPCHRVVGSDGELIGYAGGVDKKVWLLEHELKNSSN